MSHASEARGIALGPWLLIGTQRERLDAPHAGAHGADPPRGY